MKISDGFDARRLRPKGPSNWRLRLVACMAALLAIVGLLLAGAGGAGHVLQVRTPVGRAAAVGAVAPVRCIEQGGGGMEHRLRHQRTDGGGDDGHFDT